MGRHEPTVRGDVAEELVERGSIGAVLDRVHPHEHPVETEQLIPHLVDGVVGVHDGLCFDAELVERLERVGENLCATRRGAAPSGLPERASGWLVGEGGFEPPTSCSQSTCATAAPLPGRAYAHDSRRQ